MLKVCMGNGHIHRGKNPSPTITQRQNLWFKRSLSTNCWQQGEHFGNVLLVHPALHFSRHQLWAVVRDRTQNKTSPGENKTAIFFSQSQPWTSKAGLGFVPKLDPLGSMGTWSPWTWMGHGWGTHIFSSLYCNAFIAGLH